jgi:hypothetical protein
LYILNFFKKIISLTGVFLVTKNKKIYESSLWLAFGIAGFILTLGFMGPLPDYELGASFWPQVVLIGIILISTSQIIIQSLFGSPSNDGLETSMVSEDKENAENKDLHIALKLNVRTVSIFILPLVYVLFMHKFGFFLVTPIFLPLYMLTMGVKSFSTISYVSVGVFASIIFLFVYLAFTPLPQGAGFFHSLNGQFIGFFQ